MHSSVKNSLVAAAVATVLGTGAAHAVAPSAGFTYTFYAAGGSAQENSAFVAAAKLLVPSSIDVYTTDSGGGNDNNYLIVAGTLNTGAGAAVGAGNVLFFYRFGGGSFPNGIEPQANTPTSAAGQVVFPTASGLTAVATSVASPATNPASPTYRITSTATESKSPDWGLSDEEVSLFNFQDNLNNSAALTASQLSSISQDGIYDDVFGFAVTNAVYNGTNDFAGHAKTSFSKEELQGVLSGAVTNWDQLFDDTGAAMPNKALWLLDRGSGSGSKAAGNQYILNYPGGIATGGALAPHSVTTSSVNGGYSDTVLSLSGGYQDVKESSNTAIVGDLQLANAAGHGAIAVLAAQFAPALNTVGGALQYSFAKIGGVGIDSGTGTTDNINTTGSTTYSNVVTGAYDFVYQNSFNTRGSFLTTNTTAPNVKWANAIKTQLQSEGLSAAYSGQTLPNAVSGVLIDPVLAPAQDGGVVLWSRNKVSTAPIQINFDGTSVNGGKITYGSDPL